MIDIDERLQSAAQRATAGIALEDPSASALHPCAELHARRSSTFPRARRRSLVAVAAVIALVGAAGVAHRISSGPERVEAAGSPETPTPSPDVAKTPTPRERLSDAVRATLAAAPFEVRPTEEREPDAMPGAAHGVISYDASGRVARSWSDGGAASTGVGERSTVQIYDAATDEVLWLESDGRWRRAAAGDAAAGIDVVTFWGEAACVADGASGELVIVVFGDCPADLTSHQTAMVVTLHPDGRIDEVRRPSSTELAMPAVPGWTSRIVYGDVAPISLPADAEILDVPTPSSFGDLWSIDTGHSVYAVPQNEPEG